MGFDDCYQLGNVVKTHGLQGEVVFFLDVDNPFDYKNLESVFVEINEKLVPFFIESIRIQGERAIVKLEDVADINSAQDLIGKPLYLPTDLLPKLKKGQYYFHQLVGMTVLDHKKKIGTVTQVFQASANNLLGVDCDGKEVLIPLEDGIVKEVDVDKGEIQTELPEGLLDIYLSE